MSGEDAFERRRIPTTALPLLTIEVTPEQTRESLAQVLSEAMVDTFFAVQPLPRYNVDILMGAMRQSGPQSTGIVDVQLTTVVHLIKCAVNAQHPPRATRDGMAEDLVRALHLPAAFKLNVKQALYDRGQLDDPTMAILLES